MLFDGLMTPVKGCLEPDLSRNGLGFDFKLRDAEKFKI
jgi:hypothetical protein